MQRAAVQVSEPTQRVPLSMSHIGLYVHDLPTMEQFYTRVLGFTVTDRGKVRGADIVFTSWDPKDHHQVALVSGRPKDLAFNHINQISFRVASVEDLQTIWRRVKDTPGVTDLRPMDHGNGCAISRSLNWIASSCSTIVASISARSPGRAVAAA